MSGGGDELFGETPEFFVGGFFARIFGDAEVVNAHLWESPNLETAAGGKDLESLAVRELGLKITALEKLCALKHSITRYRITLEVFRVRCPRFSVSPPHRSLAHPPPTRLPCLHRRAPENSATSCRLTNACQSATTVYFITNSTWPLIIAPVYG